MANFATVGSVFLFLLRPTMARASDHYGRKETLVSLLVGSSISKMFAMSLPKTRHSVTIHHFLDVICTEGISTSIKSILIDRRGNDAKGLAYELLTMIQYAALGAIGAPLFHRVAGTNAGMFGSIGTSLVLATLLNWNMVEAHDEKKPSMDFVNPFILFFNLSLKVKLMFSLFLLQSLSGVSSLPDASKIYSAKLKSFGQTRNVLIALVASAAISPVFCKYTVASLGLTAASTAGNISQTASSLFWLMATESSSLPAFLGVVANIGAQFKTVAVEAATIESLIGKYTAGEIAALMDNFKAASRLIAISMYASLRKVLGGTKEGANVPFVVSIGFCLYSEFFKKYLQSEMIKVTEKSMNPIETGKVIFDNTPFLSKTRKKIHLEEKVKLSHNAVLLRFVLDSPLRVLGIPVGKHIKLWCPTPTSVVNGKWNGKEDIEHSSDQVERKYTPSSSNEDLGVLEIVVKIYDPCEKFVDGGKMSRYLDSLAIGQSIDVAGPYGLVEYHGKGNFVMRRKQFSFQSIGLIAGGTGITPMLQLLRAMFKDPDDETKISLLYANQQEDDILFRALFDKYSNDYPTRFKVWYTLSQPPRESWEFSKGYINADMLRLSMPPSSSDTVILMCGPPLMINSCSKHLQDMDYPKHSIIEF